MPSIIQGRITEACVGSLSAFASDVRCGEGRDDVFPVLSLRILPDFDPLSGRHEFGVYGDFPETVGKSYCCLVGDQLFLIYIRDEVVETMNMKVLALRSSDDSTVDLIEATDVPSSQGRVFTFTGRLITNGSEIESTS